MHIFVIMSEETFQINVLSKKLSYVFGYKFISAIFCIFVKVVENTNNSVTSKYVLLSLPVLYDNIGTFIYRLVHISLKIGKTLNICLYFELFTIMVWHLSYPSQIGRQHMHNWGRGLNHNCQ